MTRAARKGFTLIELLIVVVIIGILAAIAIPKFANTKQKAFQASMEEDLRNLVTAEEAYFSTYATYTSTTTAMNATQSPGNTITVASASATGWAATVTNANITGTNGTPSTCHVAVGSAETTTTQNEGAPYCP